MFAQLLGFSFGFGPASACRSPERVCSSLRQDGVKGAADSGAPTRSGWGEGGVRIQGEPAVAEAGVTLHQPEARCAFSRGSCPWITGPWQWRAAQAPRRGGGDSDLCSHTGFLVVAAAALASHAQVYIISTNNFYWKCLHCFEFLPCAKHRVKWLRAKDKTVNKSGKVSALLGSKSFLKRIWEGYLSLGLQTQKYTSLCSNITSLETYPDHSIKIVLHPST